MRRAFLSLYLVIVLAILLVGWGMDKIWTGLNPEPVATGYQYATMELVEQQLIGLSDIERRKKLTQLNTSLALEFELYTFDDIANTEFSDRIEGGEIVSLNDKAGNHLFYKQLTDGSAVLRILQREVAATNKPLYKIFLVLFYLSLAVVIYIWVWPLSRDLNRLEKQTRYVGKDGFSAQVELRKGSHVQELANAFNKMSSRIRELLASRKEMTYAVSHELRTPLARMKFALEMAGEEKDPLLLKNQLAGVRDDVNALDKFVNELLSYASFDQSEQSLDLETGDIKHFCESVISALDKGVTLVSLESNLEDVCVRCDWQLMERATTNLLQNALRYASSKVHVSIAKVRDNIVIAIEDDGPGIPENERENITQAFVRLHNGSGSQTNKAKGYGLGLAIVKRIMQWHHGSLAVDESGLGGARFTLSWPGKNVSSAS